MADISTTVLIAAGSDTVDRTVYTTASVSPSANQLQLLWVHGERAAGASASPAIVGNGLTWVAIATVLTDTIATPTHRATLYRAMGSSPSSGTIVITWAAEQTMSHWGLVEFDNVRTSGADGADAIVQSGTSVQDSGTTPSVTLSAFEHANNATFCGLSQTSGATPSAGDGFSILTSSTANNHTHTEFKNSNDTGVDWTTTSTDVGLVAVEIRNATGAVIATSLEAAFDNVDATIYTTGSHTPSPNTLVILTTFAKVVSAAPASPAITGNGLTWVQIATATFHTVGTPLFRMSIYRAMGNSPSAGVTTITWEEETLYCQWDITEFSGAATTGSNGADAVVQVAQTTQDAGTTMTVTLSSFGNSENATFGIVGLLNGDNTTLGSGFTRVVETIVNLTLSGEFRKDNATTVDWSGFLSTNAGAFALEITPINATGARAAGTSGHLGIMF